MKGDRCSKPGNGGGEPEVLESLGSFLDLLRREGELVDVEAEVDPRLEIAEIHRRVIAANGPAMLFHRPLGSRFPCVTNLYGTARRAELAFGRRAFQLIEDAVRLAETALPPTASVLWRNRAVLGGLLKVGLRRRRRAPILDRVSTKVDLGELPILTTWPEDGGPFVTLPLVYTEHPDGKGHNLGIYRLHAYDRQTTGMHWQIGKGGGYHYAVAEASDEALPVNVFLGGPPAVMLAAIAPLPENVPELMLASLIQGGKLKLCDGPGPLPLLAEAEFALVGRVPPKTRRPEGPFGDHYGYYSLEHDYPVFEISHMAHRKGAVYPATVVGKPRQEDFYIGDLLQELLSPLFPLVMPGVVDLWSYGETGYHSLAGAVVRERYAREAMASAFRILGEGQLSLTKFLLVTDEAVDLRDFKATLEHILARTRVETDLFVFANLSMDTLDYTGPAVNRGSKGVWLGLGDPVRELPARFESPEPPAGVTFIQPFCQGCLVVGGPPKSVEPDLPQRLVGHPAFSGWPLIVLTEEPERAVASSINFLWTTFTRFEPAADVHAAGAEVVRNHLSYRMPILIDARAKPGFPSELFCSDDVSRRVTERWKEYFPAGVEMGDSGLAQLTPV
ncbi:MAG: UbiD family decarboxylase [Thermoanaerobaculia bacterium]